ncbi:MAG: quinone oxidoreductase [Acidimicrobiia bacterium]|nr:quinone oxidoreductase [Acidimicrobiia bacterium]
MHAIQVGEHGGPEVLRWVELPDPEPGPGQLLVDLAAAGLNFIDTYMRSGLYPRPVPFVLGNEGAGTVTAVGPDVTGFAVGDRVAWTGVIGSYATKVLVPVAQALAVPAGVDLDVACAATLQGMTAHFLVTDCFPLQPSHKCLIQAGAGGVGLLAIQMAKMRGAEVFTTVGSADKVDLAKGAGADHVILYRDEDFGEAVERIAGPRPLHVIYDGVGQQTFERGLQVLRPRGTMVTFGNASGPVEPMAPLRLMQGGSLFLTRPTLGDYTRTRPELEARANDVFGWIAAGKLGVRVGARIPLAEAADAHRMLEGRGTTGKVLLIP